MSERVLVVNADDFGRSPGVNSGVIRAHERGIVTSATLMVRWPDAEPAAAYARESALAVGLHLDLGEWVFRDGEWGAVYEVVDTADAAAVRFELERQLETFGRLMGRPPTHLDSHQHVHRDEPVRAAVKAAGSRLGVPVRHFAPGIAYDGGFFGQDGKGNPHPEAITVEALKRRIESLPGGRTELACHPASVEEGESAYDRERVQEVAALCDPSVLAAIERAGVALRSFADLLHS